MILEGARVYHSEFSFILQLAYHTLTEFGPLAIILVLIAEKLKLINLDKYMDKNVAT